MKKRYSKRFQRNRATPAIEKALAATPKLKVVKVDTGKLVRTCVEVRCQQCGKQRTVAIGDFNLGKGKYCSHKCSIAANMEYKRGDSHHNWKGGKLAASQRYSKKNKLKQCCRQITRGAIGLGWIERKPCEVCGNPAAQIHHPDYSQPFLVYFLCRKHHLEAHDGNFHNTPSHSATQFLSPRERRSYETPPNNTMKTLPYLIGLTLILALWTWLAVSAYQERHMTLPQQGEVVRG